MGREGHLINQPVNQPVDVANWKGDDEFEIYPEGARDKSLLISPQQSEYDFLIPNHRYLFKHSFKRHPDQFWTEIIAYQIGCIFDIPVPPAFVAFDSDNQICGALIEWFLNYPDQPEERFVSGGDIMVNEIPGFDRNKGQQHNFITIEKYLSALEKTDCLSDWLEDWCDMLLFDALIGNTDRHQDNWGLLWRQDTKPLARMAPVFDNGTSLGYEILETNMVIFDNPARMPVYIDKGRHHLRWQLQDEYPMQHVALLLELLKRHPTLKFRIKNKLPLFKMEQLQAMMCQCRQYSLTIPLSQARADFVCRLVAARYQTISEKITNL